MLNNRIVLLVFLLVYSLILYSTVINIPSDYSTIQAGINSASSPDTVLVQPGTYNEILDFGGKNISVGSLFLTTQDTSYISSTVINGNGLGSAVSFISGEDSTAVLSGFTILNNNVNQGGGIYCSNSTPTLENLNITGISANFGGAVYCTGSNLTMKNISMTDNSSIRGGAVYCYNSDPLLQDVIIRDNTGYSYGGGIYFAFHSDPVLVNVVLESNNTNSAGFGGGLCFKDLSVGYLENVRIVDNTAGSGGGIYFENSSGAGFDLVNRSSIFLNAAGTGNDLYADGCPVVNVAVDTFSVMQPDDFFAFPIDNFTFDILNSKIISVDSDLYVDPEGSDGNSGLTPADPLKTLSYALSVIQPDSITPNSIYLAEGVYSASSNGEVFPVSCRSYVSIIGENEETTILDGGSSAGIKCVAKDNISLENLTIRNCSTTDGAGVYCYESDIGLKNITLKNNSASGFGGGMYCWDSSPVLENVRVDSNSAEYGAGIYCNYHCAPDLSNVTVSNNSSHNGGGIFLYNSDGFLKNIIIYGNTTDLNGGGILCNLAAPQLENVLIYGNTASLGGAVYCSTGSDPVLDKVTIAYNTATTSGGSFYCTGDSNPIAVNSIILNNDPDEVFIDTGDLTATYSNIGGNWTGTGNIDADPLFVDGFGGDFNLQAGSPCIDTGDPLSDQDPDGTRTDMGAFYFDQAPPAAPENLQMNISGEDIILTWNSVDTTSTGYPVTVDRYLVYYSEVTEPDSLFFYHGYTTDTTYTHYGVITHSDKMFYKVGSYKFDLKILEDWLNDHPEFRKSEFEAFIEEKKRSVK